MWPKTTNSFTLAECECAQEAQDPSADLRQVDGRPECQLQVVHLFLREEEVLVASSVPPFTLL